MSSRLSWQRIASGISAACCRVARLSCAMNTTHGRARFHGGLGSTKPLASRRLSRVSSAGIRCNCSPGCLTLTPSSCNTSSAGVCVRSDPAATSSQGDSADRWRWSQYTAQSKSWFSSHLAAGGYSTWKLEKYFTQFGFAFIVAQVCTQRK